MNKKEQEEEKKQLFYDLYNNCLNKKANEKTFNAIYKNNKIIANIYYNLCMLYLNNSESILLTQAINNMSEIIKIKIFKA